jgi:hypothetical protein
VLPVIGWSGATDSHGNSLPIGNECSTGVTDIPAITEQLLNSPIWCFWRD